jgi:sulfonate transport system permease protein
MYQSTFTGTRNVDRRIVESARSFGLRRLALFRKVIIPMSMPAILTGLRLAMTFSILGLVIAEQINSTAGIGFLLIQAQDYGQFFREFGCVMIYIFLGIAADLIVRVIEAFSLKWRAGVANR